jgi:CBS domain-containing protein
MRDQRMNARDLMSADTTAVSPETPLQDVARTLLAHRMSAVPVVEESGRLVGIISEGDLIGRKKTEREARREEWLIRLAEGEPLSAEFLASMQTPLATAKEIMTTPVVTVDEDTPAAEIASLMAEHRIKRIPVLRDGKIVGIARRADLLRAIGGAAIPIAPVVPQPTPGPPQENVRPQPSAFMIHEREEDLTADDLRLLVAYHWQKLDAERARHRAEAAEQRRRELGQLIETHVSEKRWDRLIHGAREAAERGETEFLLLRFPSQLCGDGGRAINALDPHWPTTLRGEAAELYRRWECELRPRHFQMSARVLDFPDGIPGDIGLFLNWAT